MQEQPLFMLNPLELLTFMQFKQIPL